MHTLLHNLSRHLHRQNGQRQTESISSAIGDLIEECPEEAHTGLRVRAGGDPSWKKWQQLFKRIRTVPLDDLKFFAGQAERVANRCQRRAVDASLKEFAS